MSSEIESVFVSFPTASIEDQNAREEYFVGDVAEWAAQKATKFGDLILAKHMVIEWVYGDRHNTAWVEHQGTNPATGEKFHLHHVTCDCIRHVEDKEEEGIMPADCPLLLNALTERAHMINRMYKIHDSLNALANLETDDQNETYQDMVLCVMEETLVEDRLHPDHWMANMVSGKHHVDLMSEILHIPPSSVEMYAGILELQGKIDVDGDVLKLKQAA